MKTRALILILCAAACQAAFARPFTTDDLLKLQRVGDVQISPDGRWVAYTVTSINVDANAAESNLWLASTVGAAPRQLTYTGKDRGARWSPDGKQLAFLSRRDGKSQVYLLRAEGGEAQALTKSSVDIDTLRWAPDGATLVVTAFVYPDCDDDACNKTREERKARESTARVYDA